MALYNTIGQNYAALRRPDARIAEAINASLGEALRVANIGAGAGSYEPRDRHVIAVEPSDVMIRQRPATAAPCLLGSAETLPLETASVDAAMAILTTHHWSDRERGFREMARVARHRVVILTWVPDANPNTPFWLTRDYFPEIEAYDRTIFPSAPALTAMLERCIGPTRMSPLMVPHDCTDGFLCAYWRRPKLYLDPARRAAISSFARVDAEPGLAKLRADLDSGRWTQRNGELLELNSFDAGYRLVTCDVANAATGNS
jgi:SAM-dependent methyltransferase